jgi:hypothetical protein
MILAGEPEEGGRVDSGAPGAHTADRGEDGICPADGVPSACPRSVRVHVLEVVRQPQVSGACGAEFRCTRVR